MAKNFLLRLPYDLFISIIKYLNLQDLRNLMSTCKDLRDVISNEDVIWKWLFRNRIVIKDPPNRYSQSISYYNQCRISSNWSIGIYKHKQIVQHHAKYMPWLQLYNAECLFLSLQSNLTCYPLDRKGFPWCRDSHWTVEVPKVLRYDVRTNDISRFIVKDNVIACGNRDGSTTIYKHNKEQRPSIVYHIRDCHNIGQYEVSAVELVNCKSNPCAITASLYSSELSFWYWKWTENTYDTTTQLDYHNFDCNTDPSHPVQIGIRSMAVNEIQDKLAIGLYRNSKPLLLDINTCHLLMEADETRNPRQMTRDIQWHDENTIVYVTHSGTVELIDVRTNAVVYEAKDPFQSSLYCVKTDGNHAIVVGSSEYSRCVLYDRRYKKHVQIYFTQKASSPIYSLDFDSKKLIAAADRNTAALNFNVSVINIQSKDYSQSFEVVRQK